MNKFLSIALVSFFCTNLCAQNINTRINVKEVERIETALASDDMQEEKLSHLVSKKLLTL